MAARAPKWPTGSGKVSTPSFWVLPSTLASKFFDPSTPYMRKINDGRKTGGKRMSSSVEWPNADWNANRSCQLVTLYVIFQDVFGQLLFLFAFWDSSLLCGKWSHDGLVFCRWWKFCPEKKLNKAFFRLRSCDLSSWFVLLVCVYGLSSLFV